MSSLTKPVLKREESPVVRNVAKCLNAGHKYEILSCNQVYLNFLQQIFSDLFVSCVAAFYVL